MGTVIKASEIYAPAIASGEDYDIFKDKHLIRDIVGIIKNAQQQQQQTLVEQQKQLGVNPNDASVRSSAPIVPQKIQAEVMQVSNEKLAYNKDILHASVKELIKTVKKEGDKNPNTTLKEYIGNIDLIYDLMLKPKIEAEFEKRLPYLINKASIPAPEKKEDEKKEDVETNDKKNTTDNANKD